MKQCELGKKSPYPATYSPKYLFPIPRAEKREELGIVTNHLPFFGFDHWNHYEVSWLNSKGKPVVAMAQISYPCNSPFLIESKSLKLYFNSFNQTKFHTHDIVRDTIVHDLTKIIHTDVHVAIHHINKLPQHSIIQHLPGKNLDELDINCDTYEVEPNYLTVNPNMVEETLCSDLLKSNCLVTNQPDWGSIQIHYRGQQINHEGLLRYLISFRNHNEFHEQCIERIFMDIKSRCQPEILTIYGRYTRRGGLDINPYRSTDPCSMRLINWRLVRQ